MSITFVLDVPQSSPASRPWRHVTVDGSPNAAMLSYCRQLPVLVSQVEPAGQHAEQIAPAHRVVPGGQSAPKTSQVVGFRFDEQRQAPLGDAAGQQVAALFGQAPLTQVHVPAEQMALSWQRVPQLPQLRESVIRFTQAPPHDTVPGGLATHLPRLQRFLPFLRRHRPLSHFSHSPHGCLHLPDLAAAASSERARPGRLSTPLRAATRARRREPTAVKDRASASNRSASIERSLQCRMQG
jgi:hypothetical protein